MCQWVYLHHHHWFLIYSLSHVSACRGLKSRSPLRAHLHVDVPYAYSDALVKTLDKANSPDIDYLVSLLLPMLSSTCIHGAKQLRSHASHLPHLIVICAGHTTRFLAVLLATYLSAVESATQGQCVLCKYKAVLCRSTTGTGKIG